MVKCFSVCRCFHSSSKPRRVSHRFELNYACATVFLHTRGCGAIIIIMRCLLPFRQLPADFRGPPSRTPCLLLLFLLLLGLVILARRRDVNARASLWVYSCGQHVSHEQEGLTSFGAVRGLKRDVVHCEI